MRVIAASKASGAAKEGLVGMKRRTVEINAESDIARKSKPLLPFPPTLSNNRNHQHRLK